MLFEKEQDRLVPLGAASKLLAEEIGDREFSPCTIYRWTSFGIRLRDNTRVRLKTDHVGGRVYTRISFLRDFLQAVSLGKAPPPRDPPTKTKAKAAFAEKAAKIEADLDALGIK